MLLGAAGNKLRGWNGRRDFGSLESHLAVERRGRTHRYAQARRAACQRQCREIGLRPEHEPELRLNREAQAMAFRNGAGKVMELDRGPEPLTYRACLRKCVTVSMAQIQD